MDTYTHTRHVTDEVSQRIQYLGQTYQGRATVTQSYQLHRQ